MSKIPVLVAFAVSALACTTINLDRMPPSGPFGDDRDASPPRDSGDARDAGDASEPAVTPACDGGVCPKREVVWDATGDGRADYLFAKADGVYVAASTGASFAPPARWIAKAAIVAVAPHVALTPSDLFFADVTGDGKADAVFVDGDALYVAVSDGARFSSPTRWTAYRAPSAAEDGPYFREAFGDVTGDGIADAVFVTSARVYVMVSDGKSFALAQNWTDGEFFGNPYTLLGDVDGDGDVDIVATGQEDKAYAMRSNGRAFNDFATWTEPVILSGRRYATADVTGDGKADLVELSDTGAVAVLASNGQKFLAGAAWTADPPSADSSLVDVTGDGKADLVTRAAGGLDVRVSTGQGFTAVVRWFDGAL